jgi:hypothetical protein
MGGLHSDCCSSFAPATPDLHSPDSADFNLTLYSLDGSHSFKKVERVEGLVVVTRGPIEVSSPSVVVVRLKLEYV